MLLSFQAYNKTFDTSKAKTELGFNPKKIFASCKRGDDIFKRKWKSFEVTSTTPKYAIFKNAAPGI